MKEKEIKSFFGKDNKLNKGYQRINNLRENDNNHYRKKFEHILPPIEILSEYENIHPGTLGRLIDMAEKEQHHRHAIELVNAENHQRAVKIGRNTAIITIITICITTICLSQINNILPIVFPVVSFMAIALLAFLAHLRINYSKKTFDGKNSRNFNNNSKV